jgi:calmodulin
MAIAVELIQFVLPDPPNQHVENAWLKEAARQVRFGKLTAARRGRDPRTGEEADAGATADAGSDGDDGTGSEMLEEQQELLRAFREFDRDGDGTVTPAEFRQGLNRCDIDIPKANLMKMVEKLSDQKLDSVWNTIDQDGSGDMDASELQTVLTTMGNKMSEADVGRLARKLDRDHDGTISKTEFRKWWARQPAHAKEKMVSIQYADFVSTFDPLENALRRIFNDIDESNDGTLDAQEIWRLCRDMGAELDARELKEAMREMDGDGSGEVDFEEFHAWITSPRKHSRKLAKAMSEFRSKRLAGGARQERPYGRPTAGRAGDETFNRAKEAYLPHMITRKKQPASAAITQLDEEYYDRQQHAGVLLGEPAVTVKPGQQAGAGTRESHYEGPRGAAVGKRDPNGYIPYKPHEPIIAASLEKLMEKLPLADKSLAPVWKEIDRRLIETGELDAEALPSVLNTVGQSMSDSDVAAIGRKLVRRKGKVASLRKEFEGMHVGALKQRALSVGVDKEMVATWWSGPASQGPLSRGVGMQTSSTVPKNANEDDHYTLVPPWQGEEDDYREGREQKEGQLNRISNARIGRYIGLLKNSEEVNVKEDLAGIQEHNEQLHTWIDPRSCWVGGIPRKHASERAMRKIFDEHGMSAVSITVRVKNRVTSVRGTPSVANRSWALVEFVDKNTAMRARKAKVMVDDDSGRAVALKVREAQVEQQLAKSRAQAEQDKTTRLARSMAEGAAVEEGEIERVTVEYPLNEGGWGAASRWPEGSRDESGQPQGRMTYPVKDGTDEPLTKGRWVGGSADSRNGFKATVEQRGRAGNTAPPGGVSKQTDKWGNPQYAPPERPKAKSSVHQEVIDAIIQTVPASRAAAKRKELGNIKVRELREKAEAAGVDSATLEKWWSVVGEKMASEKVSQARHLQVHWDKRYIGMNPDEPFAGWGEKPGQRDKLRYS